MGNGIYVTPDNSLILTIKTLMKIFFYKFFFILLILGSFFIVADARADYYSEGTVLSNNLLSDQSGVAQITTFVAQTFISANTTISVQFSQDGILWYGSNNEQGGWYALSDGSNSIDIRNLNWTTANFYYRAKLTTSDPYMAPILGEVRVDYSDLYLPSQFPDEGTILSINLLAGKTDVAQITYFKVNTIIPASTSIAVQFSQDGILWYGSGNVQGGWFVLADGVNAVDVRPLNWTTANFYYRARLTTSDLNVTPTLMQTEVDYSDSYVPSEFPAEGTVLSTNLMSGIGMIIGDGGYFIYDIPSLPSGTGVTAQFSTDGNIWYNSSGVKGGTDTLSVGSHLTAENGLSLAALGWNNNTSFYYKLTLTTTDSSKSPMINQAGLLIDIASSVWFNFDDGYGNKAYSGDTARSRAVGNLQPGSAGANTTATAMWDKNGLFGGAMEFDGTDDRLTITNFQLSDNTKLSISQAINFQSLETSKPIFSQWGNGDNSILIKSDNINADELRVCIASSLTDDCTNYAYTNDANFTLNRWYNIQIIYDGQQSTNDTRLKIYIDGKQKPLSFSGIIPSTLQNPLSSLEIGGDGDLASYFNGKVDEIKSSNSVLTKNEIDILKNGGSPMMMGYDSSRNNNGIRVTGAAKEYCIPGDTAKCDGSVGEWNMDEGSGITLFDKSGNGNNGALSGSPVWGIGKIGSALSFNGIDNWVNIGDNSDLHMNNAKSMTFSAWVKNNPSSYYHTIFRYDDLDNSDGDSAGTRNLYLIDLVPTSNKVRFSYGPSSSLSSVTSNQSIDGGVWHYITVVRDVASDTERIYIDGKMDIIETDTTSGTWETTGQYSMIGRYLDVYGTSAFFRGIIDDAKIYNYARTPAQIAWDYNRGKPIAHWKFNEGENLIAHDESGNGKNGTLVNMTPATDWVVGKNDKALDFDGIDDYVQAGTNPIVGSAPFSISNWVKAGNHSDYGLALSIGNATGSQAAWLGWVLNANVGSSNSLGGGFYGRNYGTGINDNNWHHLMLTFSGGTNGTAILYIDGVPKVTDIYTPNLQSTAISMGKANSGITYQYKGLIDDTKIFNYALTPEQVKQDYAGGSVIFE